MATWALGLGGAGTRGASRSAHQLAVDPVSTGQGAQLAVLAALTSLPVPDPGTDYGARVWQKIAPRLPERPPVRWWQFYSSSLAAGWRAWLEPRRLAALGAVAAIAIVAFLAGRVTKQPAPVAVAADASKIRERVLVMAVGEHLGRSEMMLIELGNAEPENSKQKEVNISTERRRAEDLVPGGQAGASRSCFAKRTIWQKEPRRDRASSCTAAFVT